MRLIILFVAGLLLLNGCGAPEAPVPNTGTPPANDTPSPAANPAPPASAVPADKPVSVQ